MDPDGSDPPEDPSSLENNANLRATFWSDFDDWNSEFWPAWPEPVNINNHSVEATDSAPNRGNGGGNGGGNTETVTPLSRAPLDLGNSTAVFPEYDVDLGVGSGAWDLFLGTTDLFPSSDILDFSAATYPHTLTVPRNAEPASHLLISSSYARDTFTAHRTPTPPTGQALQTARAISRSLSTVRPDSETTLDFESSATRHHEGRIVGGVKRKEVTPEFSNSLGNTNKKRAVPPSGQVTFAWDVSEDRSSNFLVFDSTANRKTKTRRSNFTPEKRKEVAALRKRGACFKCKMWRKACDLGTPCQNCKNDPDKCRNPTVVFNQPCFRLDLTQCSFFRLKSALWRQPLREKMRWISQSELKLTVQCTSLREDQGPYFEVGCYHYSPEIDDIVQRKWGPETHQVLSIPTYCAFDLSALRLQLPKVVEEYREYQLRVFDQVIEAPRRGDGADEFPDIVIATLRAASRHEDGHPLLRAAVSLWMGARFVAAPRSLRGKENLGLEPIQDPDAHDKDYIPIPPMLDYQIDTSTIRWMQEVTKEMLKELWKILLRRTKVDWFPVFLVIFILLNTAEIAYEAQLLYVLEHGGEDAGYFGRHIERFSHPMLEQWKWSSQHLIFVFRYYVRRCSFGDAPIFDRSQFETASACAKLEGADLDYYKQLIDWHDDIMQQQRERGLPTTQEGPVKQTTWCRQLLLSPADCASE